MSGRPQTPQAVKVLLITNIVVFIVMLFAQNIRFLPVEVPVSATRTVLQKLSLYNILSFNRYFFLFKLFLWQPATYMFLHGDVMHIAMNMLVLFFFGPRLEHLWGTRKFTGFYIFCGILAGFANLLIPFNVSVVGASGAIYGLLIAYLIYWPNEEITLLLFFILPLRMKIKFLVLGYLAYDIVMALFSFTNRASSGVAHLAHLGGALGGFLFIKFLFPDNKPGFLAWITGRAGAVRPGRGNTRLRVLHPDADDEPATRSNTTDNSAYWEEVDMILDKISRKGMNSISPRERKILDQARFRQR